MSTRILSLAIVGASLFAFADPADCALIQYGLASMEDPVERRSGVEVGSVERLFPQGISLAGTVTYSADPEYLLGQFAGPVGPAPVYGDFALQVAVDGATVSAMASAVIGDQLCARPPPSPGLPVQTNLDCLVLAATRMSYGAAPLLGLERMDGEGRH